MQGEIQTTHDRLSRDYGPRAVAAVGDQQGSLGSMVAQGARESSLGTLADSGDPCLGYIAPWLKKKK